MSVDIKLEFSKSEFVFWTDQSIGVTVRVTNDFESRTLRSIKLTYGTVTRVPGVGDALATDSKILAEDVRLSANETVEYRLDVPISIPDCKKPNASVRNCVRASASEGPFSKKVEISEYPNVLPPENKRAGENLETEVEEAIAEMESVLGTMSGANFDKYRPAGSLKISNSVGVGSDYVSEDFLNWMKDRSVAFRLRQWLFERKVFRNALVTTLVACGGIFFWLTGAFFTHHFIHYKNWPLPPESPEWIFWGLSIPAVIYGLIDFLWILSAKRCLSIRPKIRLWTAFRGPRAEDLNAGDIFRKIEIRYDRPYRYDFRADLVCELQAYWSQGKTTKSTELELWRLRMSSANHESWKPLTLENLRNQDVSETVGRIFIRPWKLPSLGFVSRPSLRIRYSINWRFLSPDLPDLGWRIFL